MKQPSVGDTAPDFSLPGSDGKEHALSDYRGSWVLVYFYPKDNTPGCTIEAEVLRDSARAFKKRKVTVLGISPDSVKSHVKFSEKLNLSFALLANEDKKVIKKYGVWGKKKFMGRAYDGVFRQSFLIRPSGKIAKVYTTVRPAYHAEEVLADLDELA